MSALLFAVEVVALFTSGGGVLLALVVVAVSTSGGGVGGVLLTLEVAVSTSGAAAIALLLALGVVFVTMLPHHATFEFKGSRDLSNGYPLISRFYESV